MSGYSVQFETPAEVTPKLRDSWQRVADARRAEWVAADRDYRAERVNQRAVFLSGNDYLEALDRERAEAWWDYQDTVHAAASAGVLVAHPAEVER